MRWWGWMLLGAVLAGSIDIPDTTTASSFHVDSTGRAWIGANASNFATAPFRVTAAGAVKPRTVPVWPGAPKPLGAMAASAVSSVTIPANADCSITAIKSADQAIRRAALGARPVVRLDPAGAAGIQVPGASGDTANRRKGVIYLK